MANWFTTEDLHRAKLKARWLHMDLLRVETKNELWYYVGPWTANMALKYKNAEVRRMRVWHPTISTPQA